MDRAACATTFFTYFQNAGENVIGNNLARGVPGASLGAITQLDSTYNLMIVNRIISFAAAVLVTASGAFASDEDQIRSFLKITGFDVAIESIQLGAMAGPGMTGEDPEVFGRQWQELAREVFEPDAMVEDAIEMLAAVLPQDVLDHGMAFYESPLGQRLVEVENESHMTDDAVKYTEGAEIVADLLEAGDLRVQLYKAMGDAIGSTDVAIRSLIEIQVRYLMAAMAAGASDLELDEDDLRGILQSQSDQMREGIEENSLIANAYAYRAIGEADLIDYLAALQDPRMGQVYEILNAVQFEIMANRYETMASRLDELAPETEL